MDYETNKISYTKGAIVPQQTDEDIESIPKFIITGHEHISEKLKTEVLKYLISAKKKRINF